MYCFIQRSNSNYNSFINTTFTYVKYIHILIQKNNIFKKVFNIEPQLEHACKLKRYRRACSVSIKSITCNRFLKYIFYPLTQMPKILVSSQLLENKLKFQFPYIRKMAAQKYINFHSTHFNLFQKIWFYPRRFVCSIPFHLF